MTENDERATVVGTHARVQIQTPEGHRESVLACRIEPEDCTEDGRVRYPPSGECDCFDHDAVGRCQTIDSAIVVDNQTVPIESLNIQHGGVEGISTMEGGRQEYEFSFTVSFEDEEEARKFREFFSK